MSKSVINAVNVNAECTTYTLEQIKEREPDFDEWELRNDMVKRVVVQGCDYGFLSLGIDYVSGMQGVGYGYRSEGNIGMMILALADLVGVKYTNGDILAALKGKPIRVLFKKDFGGSVADCTYIGNFMADRWLYMKDLVMAGIVEEEVRNDVNALLMTIKTQAMEINQLRQKLIEERNATMIGVAEITRTQIRNAKDILAHGLVECCDTDYTVPRERYDDVVKALRRLVERLDAEGIS